MSVIPDEYLDLFDSKAFGDLATLMPDGSMHVTPVWIDYDGEHVLVNTAKGRQKWKNVKRDPGVSLCVMDPEDPYCYLSVQGEVVETTEDGAVEHIDALAGRYMGVDEYRAVCENYGTEPRQHTQFWHYVKDLDRVGAIDAQKSGKGNAEPPLCSPFPTYLLNSSKNSSRSTWSGRADTPIFHMRHP